MDLAMAMESLEVSSAAPESSPELADLVEDIRRQADRFVFLCGGAGNMDTERHQAALAMFDALAQLAREGYRLAVGDGGTRSGIMAAAGKARGMSGNKFVLLGVAPAVDVPPRGNTPIEPNHSHIVTVVDPLAPPVDAWGTETATMYWLFARLSSGRPSVAVLVNGGKIALKEVLAHIEAGRVVIAVEGSGRAADALACLLNGKTPTDGELADLCQHARSLGLPGRSELFRLLPVSAGAKGLRDAIVDVIGGRQS
jgi:SLOG in TRPM, prokaryote